MIKLYQGVTLRLAKTLLIVASISSVEAGDVQRCRDLFNSVSTGVKKQHIYNNDFGSGVFVWKVSPTEFRIEPPPPPLIVKSAREAQRKVGDLARNNSEEGKFTILFQGISEAEAIAFKSMLQRDARYEGDNRLSSVLLETENNATKETKGYELFREPAIRARDLLLRRYDWSKAKVTSEKDANVSRNPPQELYRMIVEQQSASSESFLLRLRLKSLKSLKNRTSQIMTLLSAPNLANATTEQMAHAVIYELKKSDKGITAGTLKVMAGDFIIAQTFRVEGG